MEVKTNATETIAAPIAPQEEVKVITSTEDDLEDRNVALEAEKARLEEEKENYRKAYLKASSKKEENLYPDEDEDDKITRKVNEAIANSRLAEIAQEQDTIIKKALKENKELKLAQMNKTNTPPAGMGTHSESVKVQDTTITPELDAYFKSRNFNAKDIERYKKTLAAKVGR